MRSLRPVSLALALVVPLAGCGSSTPPARKASKPRAAAVESADDRFGRTFDTFFAAYLERNPTFAATDIGLHEFDGKLPKVTGTALADELAWLESQIQTFEAFAPDDLGDVRRVEREAVLAHLREKWFEHGRMKSPLNNPMFYLGDLSLDAYISRDYAPLEQRARGVIGIASGAAEHLLAAQANLPGNMPRPWIETALMMTSGHIAFARKDVATAFAGVADTELLDKLSVALASYTDALGNYKKFLIAARKNATDDYALGAELFVEMVAKTEGFAIDLARLEEIGNADLERNWSALELAATALDRSPDKAAKLVATDRPLARDLLKVATAQAVESRKFLVDKGIVTIPSEDIAVVEETPEFARWNSAFLSAPGILETKPLPTFYWITLPDPSWPKAEQKAYIPGRQDLLFTTVHELWPGHFLHHLHMRKNPSIALRAFCSYAMAEGWAHYAEEMMVEEGFGGPDPRARVGMLLNALLRNVRYVSAIGLHAKGMTVDASAKLFATRALADKKSARQQATRGTFDPGYLNYTLGKLAIRKLRDDWKAKQGAAYSTRAFHDRVLSYGCAPLPAIRRAMMGDDSPAL